MILSFFFLPFRKQILSAFFDAVWPLGISRRNILLNRPAICKVLPDNAPFKVVGTRNPQFYPKVSLDAEKEKTPKIGWEFSGSDLEESAGGPGAVAGSAGLAELDALRIWPATKGQSRMVSAVLGVCECGECKVISYLF